MLNGNKQTIATCISDAPVFLIAANIFPPQIGGPAWYGKRLAEELTKKGYKVVVVTYGKHFYFKEQLNYFVSYVSLSWPTLLRQLLYLLKVCWHARGANGIFALDSLGAGFPAVLAGKFLNKKVIIRLGGDFLWEKFIENGRGFVTMADFNEKGFFKSFSKIKKIIEFTLRNAYRVVFTTDFQKKLFVRHYSLKEKNSLVISNVFDQNLERKAVSYNFPKTILWAGRFIKLKNLPFLIKVFIELLNKDHNLRLELVGDGPEKDNIARLIKTKGLEDKAQVTEGMDKKSLQTKIAGAYFCVLPSLTEVSPNFAFECLAFGKPILITQETGIKEQFPGLLYADPKDENSFIQAGFQLLNDDFYAAYQEKIFSFRFQYKKSWPDLTEEYLKLFL